ncbi:MAG: methyltransferase domain-containing protein [Reyranella sp.]|nr:methyltransferase domain-containing protein [Reyranella sp.]
MIDDADLGRMPLYTSLDRIEGGLANLGIGPGDPIRPEQLFSLDQWHYHGTDAVAAAARALGLGPSSRVLDVGAGVGGPARYLAHTFGCHVTALELQPALHEIGVDLTRRSGLSDCVTHVCADALSHPLPSGSFDAVVSLLAVLHIPDRPRLFSRLARVLRAGGRCYLEDLCQRAPLAPRDLDDLRTVVCGVTVTSSADYAADLAASGFTNVVSTDLTDDWAPYAAERLARWRQNHAAYARVHGEEAYAAQARFYAVIARLYDSGSLGGVRLTARA